MARPDSGDIDRVVLDTLKADSALVALMPGGVYFNLAPPNLTRGFVLVTIDRSTDEDLFQHRGLEEVRYVVQGVALSRDVALGPMRDTAARIDTLLNGDPPLATPTAYASIDCVRDERLAESVVDELDKTLHW